MNLSSLLILCPPSRICSLREELNGIAGCEVHLESKEGKIIVTLEGESVAEELALLRTIQALPGVLSAEMVFSYCGEELSRHLDELQGAAEVPQILQDEELDAKEVRYGGDLREV